LEKKKNILFVAFEFPPLGGGGVQRSIKFTKYLSEFGINPIVITVEKEDCKKVMPNHQLDFFLEKELSTDLVIERIHCDSFTPSSNKFKNWFDLYFSISEVFKKTWKPNLEKRLPKIIEQYKPEAIYVTIPPFAMATLWRKLLAPYNIPVIFDFRDAWSQWCVNVNGSYLHYWFKKMEERKAINFASSVVCTSNQIKADLLNVHPATVENKISVITNGFDFEFEIPEKMHLQKRGKIIIGYVGSFYYTPTYRDNIFKPWWKKPIHRMINYVPRKEDWLYRSPYFFFKAIREMLNAHSEFESKLEIRFAGNTPNWLIDQIQDFNLQDVCKHYGYLQHNEVLQFQDDCDCLLITSSKVLGGRDYSIAGKTFEYFTFGKPILAFVCEGVQKDILLDSGMALILDPDNSKNSSQKLFQFINGQVELFPQKENIVKHHRKVLTKKLAAVIEETIAQKKDRN
jgi:glycosyltransferase involved in cell wall biosynthesis